MPDTSYFAIARRCLDRLAEFDDTGPEVSAEEAALWNELDAAWIRLSRTEQDELCRYSQRLIDDAKSGPAS